MDAKREVDEDRWSRVKEEHARAHVPAQGRSHVHTPPDGRRHSAHRVEEAEETVQDLRTALARAGITLPSLRIDLASVARDTPCPLIVLGGCSVEAAARLAAALR
ncbi:hypothetical protein [Streptomyces sp. NPDC005281]|uniref:hypothetical protein n=1 Tax=Streptomyces sp. NPDC005281 TaxID=3155712 RepID=UPI00339E9427